MSIVNLRRCLTCFSFFSLRHKRRLPYGRHRRVLVSFRCDEMVKKDGTKRFRVVLVSFRCDECRFKENGNPHFVLVSFRCDIESILNDETVSDAF